MMTGFGFGWGWGMVGMMAMMLVFWGGLVALVVLLVRALFPRGQQLPGGTGDRVPTARELLDQRYARGDITREQFEQMKRDLS
jgi:putative membrane protein